MRYCMKLEAGVLVTCTYSCYYIAGIANETKRNKQYI